MPKHKEPLVYTTPETVTFTTHDKERGQTTFKVNSKAPGFIAYRVRTTQPKLFAISPNCGVIGAGESAEVSVKYRPSKDGKSTPPNIKLLCLAKEVASKNTPETEYQFGPEEMKSPDVTGLKIAVNIPPAPRGFVPKSADSETQQSAVSEAPSLAGGKKDKKKKPGSDSPKTSGDSPKDSPRTSPDALLHPKTAHDAPVVKPPVDEVPETESEADMQAHSSSGGSRSRSGSASGGPSLGLILGLVFLLLLVGGGAAAYFFFIRKGGDAEYGDFADYGDEFGDYGDY